MIPPVQFAINYSPQAEALLHAGQIRLDCFKCPDWPDLVATALESRPVAVHFDLHAGGPQPMAFDPDLIERLLAASDTPTVNTHLHARAADYPDIPVDSTEPAHLEAIGAALIRDVELLVDRFGPERVIVENAPYAADRGKVMRACIEPAVIRRVVEATGCGLLLDLSHAWITAHYLGRERREYIGALPVERIREIHVTGVQDVDGRRRDHLALTEPDWIEFDWALGQIAAGAWATPWLLAFEYGGVGPKFEWRSQAEVIAAQAPRLYAGVHALPEVKHA